MGQIGPEQALIQTAIRIYLLTKSYAALVPPRQVPLALVGAPKCLILINEIVRDVLILGAFWFVGIWSSFFHQREVIVLQDLFHLLYLALVGAEALKFFLHFITEPLHELAMRYVTLILVV